MSFVLLGILNSQAAGGAPDYGTATYDLLQSNTYSGVNTITISNIASTYTAYEHLFVTASMRNQSGNGTQGFRFNQGNMRAEYIEFTASDAIRRNENTSYTTLPFSPEDGETVSVGIMIPNFRRTNLIMSGLFNAAKAIGNNNFIGSANSNNGLTGNLSTLEFQVGNGNYTNTKISLFGMRGMP